MLLSSEVGWDTIPDGFSVVMPLCNAYFCNVYYIVMISVTKYLLLLTSPHSRMLSHIPSWRQNLSSNFPPLPCCWSLGFSSLLCCIYESFVIILGQFNAPLDASFGNSLDATLTLTALYLTELPSFVEFPF